MSSHVRSMLLWECHSHLKTILTIAIPTFNRFALLEKAIASALAQNTNLNYEIIIVDNCSSEENITNTKKYLETLNVKSNISLKLFSNQINIGMFPNWNRCYELATSDYMIILSDDDLIDVNLIDVFFKVYEDKKAVFFSTAFLDEREMKVSQLSLKKRLKNFIAPERRYLTAVNYVFEPITHCLVLSREAVLDLGGFDTSLAPSSDLFLYSSYLQKHNGLLVKYVGGIYRLSKNESNKREVQEKFIESNFLVRQKILSKKFLFIANWAKEYDKKMIEVGWNQKDSHYNKTKAVLFFCLKIGFEILEIFKNRTIK